MARQIEIAAWRLACAAVLFFGVLTADDTLAQPSLNPVPKDCQAPGSIVAADRPLINLASALRERKKITILAIGASSIGRRDSASGGYHAVIETFLERTFKGLDVTIINRGVSGELAIDAGERIKTEVALTGAELVLWQLGTADALGLVPVEKFKESTRDTVTWLKQHKVDMILIGLRYARGLATDPHYQSIRTAIAEIAKEQGILRIGRYEVVETIEKIKQQQGAPASEIELGEADYSCMAEYLARAIATGLFAKEQPATVPRPRP
ncbi:MAG: SGNH/GDSL hydrolase family protein [Hyphomicrobiaceae bacterium]|nr:SGNH/GDSL hydrolase family protein [Hyphomicrobiaceae bacterium]